MKKLLAILLFLSSCATEPPLSEPDQDVQEIREESQASFPEIQLDNLQSELSKTKANYAEKSGSLAELRTKTNTALTVYAAKINTLKTAAATSPNGDLETIAKWEEAAVDLGIIQALGGEIASLAKRAEVDAATADYIAVSAASASNLAQTSDKQKVELSKLSLDAQKLSDETRIFARAIDLEAERQNTYCETEKQGLGALALTIKGTAAPKSEIIASPFATEEAYSEFANSPKTSALPGKRAIASVHFNGGTPDFEMPVREALSRALERNPSAKFLIEGVAKENSPTIHKRINGMATAINDMGMPKTRITTGFYPSNKTAVEEIRIYEE